MAEYTSEYMDRHRILYQVLKRNRFIRWFVFGGSRPAVVGLLLLGVFLIYFVLGYGGYFVLTEGSRLMWLFNGLVNGLLTLVTVVLAIEQLVLSEEFGSINDIYDQLESMSDFRATVAELTDETVTPIEPAAFLTALLRTLQDRATELRAEIPEDHSVSREIENYTTDVIEQSEDVSHQLEKSSMTADLLLIMLSYNDSRLIHSGRELHTEHAASLPSSAASTLEEIQELLQRIDTTRQYFKTIYLQRELSHLVRLIIYSGSLATLISGLMILVYRPPTQTTLAPIVFFTLLSGAVVVTVAPLAVLFAYTLRAATIARKTASFGPFIPQEEQLEVQDEH